MTRSLERFVDAQRNSFDQALAEVRAGAKRSHWMWYIFPQIAGLGSSPTSRLYAISDAAEARAYRAHPLLGTRLDTISQAVLGHAGRRSADAIFGPVDAMKLKSSMTLFEAAGGGAVFGEVLDAFFGGERDAATLARL